MAAMRSAALIMPGVLDVPGTLEEEALMEGPLLEDPDPCGRAWEGREGGAL